MLETKPGLTVFRASAVSLSFCSGLFICHRTFEMFPIDADIILGTAVNIGVHTSV